MRQPISVRQELVDCITRHVREKGSMPTIVRMTLTKYLRLGAEMGMLMQRIGATKIEWFLSESEKREAARAG